MKLEHYLTDTFNFNNAATRQLITGIAQLPEKGEALKLLSHVIHCQDKWMARIVHDPNETRLAWWGPTFPEDKVGSEWNRSVRSWLEYLARTTEAELGQDLLFMGGDGARYATTAGDIALHINYHCINHRAQVLTIFRQQGVAVVVDDLIRTKLRRLD